MPGIERRVMRRKCIAEPRINPEKGRSIGFSTRNAKTRFQMIIITEGINCDCEESVLPLKSRCSPQKSELPPKSLSDFIHLTSSSSVKTPLQSLGCRKTTGFP